MNKILAILICVSLFSSFSNASAASSSGGTSSSSNSTGIDNFDPRETVGVILVSGLVGGIIGLSTLSFYDKPQDHIRNITIGAGVGLIVAAIYTTVSIAQPPAKKADLDLELSEKVVLVPDINWSRKTAGAALVARF